jgi:hypothetical protein
MRRIAVVLPLLVLLAGCGAGGESGGSKAMSAPAADSAKRAAPPPGANAQPAVADADQVAVPRALVRTAAVAVHVKDVNDATAAVTAIVTRVGGDVTDEQVDLQSGGPRASMTLQVPPARLTSTLDQLGRLGHEESRTLGTEDVTGTVVDLDSRLATQQTSVTRVRTLLDRAHNLTDVVRIESELSRREADLESLQARVRALSGQVAMSKVTVQLTAGAEAQPASAVGFTDGLHGGWHALRVSARIAGATAGALLPFLPLLVGAAWVGLWWRRRTASA